MPADPVSADLHRYVKLLKARFGTDLISVVLFGSRARSEARAESDVDLLVVVRGLPQKRFERYRGLRAVARQVSETFAETVAPVLLTPEEAERVRPVYLGMLSGHVILHDSASFFAGVLDRLRRRLAELGARRYVDPDGYEYWDLKPDWKPGDVVTL
ncbi:MAG: nucleotidyltransferase domain-containing protein [Candidatus Rokuibacteriota bacterium]